MDKKELITSLFLVCIFLDTPTENGEEEFLDWFRSCKAFSMILFLKLQKLKLSEKIVASFQLTWDKDAWKDLPSVGVAII